MIFLLKPTLHRGLSFETKTPKTAGSWPGRGAGGSAVAGDPLVSATSQTPQGRAEATLRPPPQGSSGAASPPALTDSPLPPARPSTATHWPAFPSACWLGPLPARSPFWMSEGHMWRDPSQLPLMQVTFQIRYLRRVTTFTGYVRNSQQL